MLKNNFKKVTQEHENVGVEREKAWTCEFPEDMAAFFKQLPGELPSKRGIKILMGDSLQQKQYHEKKLPESEANSQ